MTIISVTDTDEKTELPLRQGQITHKSWTPSRAATMHQQLAAPELPGSWIWTAMIYLFKNQRRIMLGDQLDRLKRLVHSAWSKRAVPAMQGFLTCLENETPNVATAPQLNNVAAAPQLINAQLTAWHANAAWNRPTWSTWSS
jgi:hypothetical protein